MNDDGMSRSSYVVMLNEVPVGRGSFEPHQKLCKQSVENLRCHGFTGSPARDPRTGEDVTWLAQELWTDAAEEYGLQLYDPLDFVLWHVEAIVTAHLHELLRYQNVVDLLRQRDVASVEGTSTLADLLRAWLAERIPINELEIASVEATSTLADLLRALLAERTPINELGNICYLFLDHFERLRTGRTHIGRVVEAMRMLPGVRERLWGNEKDFTHLRVAPEVEELIAEDLKVRDKGTPPVLALKPDSYHRILAAVRAALPAPRRVGLLVRAPRVRNPLRRLIDTEFPEVPVLRMRELSPALRPHVHREVVLP
jgi:flagellar biosynthesis component FlhA